MKNSFLRSSAGLFLWLAFASFLWCPVFVAHAETPVEAISAAHSPSTLNPEAAEHIRVVARYLPSGYDEISATLQRMGFSHGLDENTWRRYPAVRKLGMAYVSAEAKQPGQGREILAYIVNEIKPRNSSIAYERAVQSLLHLPIAPDRVFQWGRAPPGALVELPTDLKAAINTIGIYARGAPRTGALQISIRHFGLDEDAAYNLFATSESEEAALLRGLAIVSPESRINRLLDVIKEIAEFQPRILEETSLRPILSSSPALPGDIAHVPEQRMSTARAIRKAIDPAAADEGAFRRLAAPEESATVAPALGSELEPSIGAEVGVSRRAATEMKLPQAVSTVSGSAEREAVEKGAVTTVRKTATVEGEDLLMMFLRALHL